MGRWRRVPGADPESDVAAEVVGIDHATDLTMIEGSRPRWRRGGRGVELG